ncbi:MAG: beta-ketoacyl-[acyl-carrier-protein] synthase family protein [Candidatus Omnitrophica bacterium]|nr:beta-ketoacyl-[acyl-carrier-protein] synthase family protein [Candidatus Omnitrophota bacterium]
MMTKRIVITGIGILAANGVGRQQYWQSLKEGKAGFRDVSLFDVSNLKVKIAGEISDFDAQKFLGVKGLRSLDRSAKLICCAGKLAIDDAKLTITEENTNDIGVVVGTTLGSVYSISEFDKEALREGPRYVNPAAFPNTVINSPASQVSIKFNIKGFNTTISTGFTASLDAIGYAIDFLNFDRAKVVFAGGVEEMCIQTFLGFYKLGFLSGSKDGQPILCCPFDKRRNGIVFGEGAVFLVLEDLEHALARNAEILAEISNFSMRFDPYRINKYNPKGDGIKKSMLIALQEGRLKPRDIDYICANANSTAKADKIETDAIKEVFGSHAKNVPVSAIKSMTGECFSVSAGFQAAAAVGAIKESFIPPTINYKEPDPECDLDYVPNQAREKEIKNVLVSSFGPSGNNSCLIIKRYEK